MEEEYEGLIRAFTEDLKVAGRSPDTVQTYPYTVRAWCKFVKNPLTVKKDDLRSYLATMRERNFTHASVERHFTIIGGFYNFLIYSEIYKSPNPVTKEFWARYLHPYKGASGVRKSPTTDEVKTLVGSILNARDLAVVVLLFVTGMRRGELCSLDRNDVDLQGKAIRLKPTAKRTNRTVFVNDEAVYCLSRYLKRRSDSNPALFVSKSGTRLAPHPVDTLFAKYVKLAGLYKGEAIEVKLTPHCARHWNGSVLYKAGMRAEFIEFLRGDKGKTTFSSTYLHLDPEQVKAEFLRCIPNLGLL